MLIGQFGGAAQNGLGHKEDQRLGQKRRDTNAHDQQAQKCGRAPHANAGIVGLHRVIVADRAKECVTDIAERIRSREKRANRGQHRDQKRNTEEHRFGGLFQHHFFGDKAVEKRDTGHGERGDRGDYEGDRHQSPQTAQLGDIARAGFMIHDASRHKESRFERGVVQNVEDRNQSAISRPSAQKHRDEAQMRDRREGQQTFEIVFKKRDDGADDHGDEPCAGDEVKPCVRARECRPEARHQEDPGLHHGGGVQIGRHRRGRGHCVRQPEMERELCGLGETAQQDQQKCRQIERALLDQLAVFQDHREVKAAHDIAQKEHPTNQGQTAHTGYSQRHARALSAFFEMLPIPDEQEGRQRC